MRIAFQGEVGAFSEEAIFGLYTDVKAIPHPSFDAVFEAVSSGAVDRGVIPIENSLFGSVHVNYDLLRSHDLRIIGELNLRVRHNLMALPDVTMADLRHVYSHPQALGQCAAFLKTNLPQAKPTPVYDTAGAAKMVAADGDRTAAAIASRQAAPEYGLHILAASIESNHQNYTRFLVLVRKDEAPPPVPAADHPCKTSIVYAQRENVPGALFKSLAVFALRDIDLFKIESRPLVGSPGKYIFYLDLNGSVADAPIQRALSHLEEIAADVKVLGTYAYGKTVG